MSCGNALSLRFQADCERVIGDSIFLTFLERGKESRKPSSTVSQKDIVLEM